VPPKGTIRLPVVLSAGSAQTGSQTASITIHTASMDQPKLSLKTRHVATDAYRLSRGKIDLGRLNVTETCNVRFDITATLGNDQPFVENIALRHAENLEGTLGTSYRKEKAVISGTFVAGPNPGPVRADIVIDLTGREEPVTVTVTGQCTESDRG